MYSNPNLRAAFEGLPAEQLCASLHVDIVGSQSLLFFGAGLKSIIYDDWRANTLT